MRTLLIAVSLIAISSNGAFAGSTQFQGTLANPPKQKSFVADSVIWRCDGAVCMTTSNVADRSAEGVCRGLVRKAGPVASFGGLSAAQVETCNGKK